MTLILNATNKSIKAVMGAAKVTTDPDFVTTYADQSVSAFTPGSSDGALNDTTPVTIVGSPAASTQRMVKGITIWNRDTVPQTITITYVNDVSTRFLWSGSVPAGSYVSYSNGVFSLGGGLPATLQIAALPAHYERSRMWKHKGSSVAADRRTLVSPDYMTVNINNSGYILSVALERDLNNSTSWDTTTGTDYTVAANRAGKQFYVYACVPVSGIVPVILCSVASTYPSGYSATTSRKIGSFHCLCVAAGTITSHPLTDYLAGDILPRSIQDLKHRPRPGFVAGMVWAGVTDYLSDSYANVWAAIYLASGTGASTASVYGGTISDTRDWLDFTDDMHAVGCRLPKDHEFQGIAFGSNEETNITGSADPVTTGGHVDTAARRMISYIGCEDCCGAMWQWLDEQSFKSDYVTGWGYYDLPGAKGSLYNQDGATGRADVKLLAGGHWDDGSYCGSRCRLAYGYRWLAASAFAARAVVEPA